MSSIRILLAGAFGASTLCLTLAAPADAMTMKECSAKYQAAKQAGTLAGATWKSFRAKECTSVASAGTTPATSASTATAPAPATTTPTRKAAAPGMAAGTALGTATFPNAIDPKYSEETPGKARMHTCLDQYKANKAANGNGGLHWIQKGGGYYSECSKKLKG